MLYSEKYKVQWWRVMRNASRTLEEIPIKLGFIDKEKTHSCLVYNPDWHVVLCSRNPYSRAISFWLLRNKVESPLNPSSDFETYIKSDNEYFSISLGNPFEPITFLNKSPQILKYVIRFENIYNDLMNIPFIQENQNVLSEILNTIRFDSRRYKAQYTEDIIQPYSSFYTQELADIVWEQKQYEFEYWGYSRDSWKTIKL